MNFDLDLWPTDLKINRDHLLTKDYLPTKFEACGAKRYWVISCTRLRDTDIPTYRPTDRQVQSNMPSFFKGGIKILRTVFKEFFSANRRLKCTIVIMHCPLFVVSFSTSLLTTLNVIQRNLTGSKISTSSTKFVFFRLIRKNDDRPTSDWLRLLRWNHWTEFNKSWQEARSQRPLPSLCLSGQSKKQDGHACLWLAETISTSPVKPLNEIQQNFTGSKISTSSTKFVFFGLIRKTSWPPKFWLAETLSTSPLKPMNGINKTGLEERSQRPLPSLCFSGWLEKQDGRPCLWLAEI